MKTRGAWMTLLCLAAAACGRGDASPPATGTLERERVELVAEVAEPIVELAVREGDHVHEGDVLLRLDPARIDAQRARARAEREATVARLALADEGPRAEAILRARAELAAAASRAQAAAADVDRARALSRVQFLSPAELDRLAARAGETRAQQRAADAGLAELLAGSRSAELAAAHAAVAAADAVLAELDLRAARVTVRAPVAGVVDALPFRRGEQPPAGATVAVLLADGRTFARVHVPAAVRRGLAAGAAASIHVDGMPQPLAGRLRHVAAEAAFTPFFALTQHDRTHLAYLAEVDVVDAPPDLPTGIAVEVHFTPAAASP
jgi:HlyD family secretion protein